MDEKRERNASIELYRVLLMLGICVLHCITLGTKRAHPLAGVLMCCVPGFVFISGWFGIRFSPSKVIRLFALGLWCACVKIGLNWLLGGQAQSGDYLRQVLELWTNGFWFLNAYVALMFLAPLVNVAVSAVGGGKTMIYLLPLLILVFGWTYLTGAPVVHKLSWPLTPGMGSNTVLTLLGVYAFARICCVARVHERLKNRHLVLIALVCLPLVAFGFGNYHSLFSAALALAGFVWMSRVNLPNGLCQFVLWLSPSMFAVYLLHSTRYGFEVIERLQDALRLPLVPCAILTGMIVFGACVLIDSIRRCICIPLNGALLGRIDRLYARIVDWCERSVAC